MCGSNLNIKEARGDYKSVLNYSMHNL